MAHGCGHATDLTVFAFDEFECDPSIWHGFPETNWRIARRQRRRRIKCACLAGQGGVIANFNATLQSGKCGSSRDALYLNPIFATVGVTRVEQLVI